MSIFVNYDANILQLYNGCSTHLLLTEETIIFFRGLMKLYHPGDGLSLLIEIYSESMCSARVTWNKKCLNLG